MRLIYKPFAIVVAVLAGILSKKAFERVWEAIADEDPSDPDDRDATWTEVLVSAAVSGMVIKVVQALVRRGGAIGFERATGFWPGDEPRG
ncbi:MAG: DUF4235 domain-containing protein [Acidobacteria bacterium]|nr:MAG: DUF4235 domain-containing protein [Acidobacteriota bacterium]MCL4287705.1 DUF4235 domain-containing protein [Thermoleophilia bacterium]GIK76547.1 MAG: hypothetical protein BroJett022_02370 [Actinomycetes bacterium]